jgi:hypothetical protein
MVGIVFISVCIQTMLYLLKASVVDVEDIWGKGDRFMGKIGE